MAQAKYDPATGKFVFPKGESVTAAPSDMAYVAIPRATMDTLAGFGVQDGATVNAETEKGKGVQRSKLARLYILQAIDNLVTMRAARK